MVKNKDKNSKAKSIDYKQFGQIRRISTFSSFQKLSIESFTLKSTDQRISELTTGKFHGR
jgi:hypothetical protein